MVYFLGIFHGNCDLRNVEGVLEFSKLDFRDLKGQFDVKKANFGGLIAKIGQNATMTHFKSNFMSFRIAPIYLRTQFPWHNSLKWFIGGF